MPVPVPVPVPVEAEAPLRIDALVPFPSHVATPGPQVATILEDVASALREHPTAIVEIAGHCDDQELETVAYARANLVASGLAARGVPRSRVKIETYGKLRPLAPNTTPEGRAKNRRVNFRVLESSGEEIPRRPSP